MVLFDYNKLERLVIPMKKNQVKAFFNLSENEINKEIRIQSTIYDRSRRYGDVTREIWKSLYAKGVSVTDISKAYGADFKTVKIVVDPKYKEDFRRRRVVYDKTYKDKLAGTNLTKGKYGYKKDLANRKVFPDISHLRTI